MRTGTRLCPWLAGLLTVLVLVGQTASGQALGRRFDFNELKQIVEDSTLVVRAKILDEPVSQGGDEQGLVWRASAEVLETLKGQSEAPKLTLHFKSPLNDLNMSRKRLPGTEYVLPLVPVEGQPKGHFRLVGDVGFAADTAEADTVAGMARGKPEPETPLEGPGLRLRIEAVSPPYEAGRAAPLRVSLQNLSDALVSYTQAPIEIRDGRLYLPGTGNLIVTDSRRGRVVMANEALRIQATPPLPAMPAVIPARSTYEREVDLAAYFDLTAPGVYMVTMALAGPEGGEPIRSNTATVQIIPPLEAPVESPGNGRPTAADALLVPAPEVYKPGEPENGIVVLLKPLQAQFEVGQPIHLELRLINVGDTMANVDTRLERTLLLSVQEQGDSPPVRSLLQHHDWPADAPESKEVVYSHLRPWAFWGKVVNANSLYGRDPSSLMLTGRAAISGAVEPTYETHGMTLFSFEKPGVYKIQATYQVKPRGGDGPRAWAGKALSNPVFVRVTAREGAEPMSAVSPP